MTAATRDEFGGMRFFPLTVRQYHRMIEQGILPEGEPYELLGGQVVRKDRSARGEDPMTVGHQHTWVVEELGDLSPRLRKLGCYMRTQQPISLPPRDEPEPDAAIVIGTRERYRGRHPSVEDVLCVIEVADASLLHDRTIDLRAYADAGIRVYVIINLPDRMIEVYTEPLKGKHRYGQSVTLGLNDKLTLPGTRGRRLTVPVKRLFP